MKLLSISCALALGLTLASCGDANETEAKKLGFMDVTTMRRVQAKGWHTNAQYVADETVRAKTLGFSGFDELVEAEVAGFHDPGAFRKHKSESLTLNEESVQSNSANLENGSILNEEETQYFLKLDKCAYTSNVFFNLAESTGPSMDVAKGVFLHQETIFSVAQMLFLNNYELPTRRAILDRLSDSALKDYNPLFQSQDPKTRTDARDELVEFNRSTCRPLITELAPDIMDNYKGVYDKFFENIKNHIRE